METYTFNRDKKDLIKFMKTKADKVGLLCKTEGDKVRIEAKPGTDAKSQTPIPVIFQGKVMQNGAESEITGRFTYGFYFTTLVIVAIILIVLRFAWSLYQMQVDNMILCGIVTLLLVIVCGVVRVKGMGLKRQMEEFLQNLNKR